MATSGSYDWILTRDQIITDALQLVGAVEEGSSASAVQISECSRALNSIVKNVQTMGLALWAREWTTAALADSTERTHNTVDYICTRGHTSSVAGATGNEPGVGDDWETFWKTGGSGGIAWAATTAYTAAGDFVPAAGTIYIEEAFIHRSDSDHPMNIIRYSEYLRIRTKYTTGLPKRLAFNNSLSDPRAFIYPQSNDTDDIVNYLRYRKLENFDATADNPDAPVSWTEVLIHALARRVSSKYGLPLQERYYLGREANRLLEAATKSDEEIVGDEWLESAY